jgi:hypothetical protein
VWGILFIVSKNSGITIRDIEAHPEIPWDLAGIWHNPNVTAKDVISRPEFWRFDSLSDNLFSHCPSLQRKMIKKVTFIRAKNRHKMYDRILRIHPILYTDFSGLIRSYIV